METGKHLSIFLVDDNEIDVFISKKMLEKHLPNATITVFCNGLEAYNYLADSNGVTYPDIILLDIKMPVMDGFSFLEACTKNHNALLQDISVIMLSSSIDPADIKKSLTYNMVKKFVNKPLLWESISAPIMQVIEAKKLKMAI
jgi:CheY-like chemotaxis protein